MREETKETFNTIADIENELRRYAKFVMGTRQQPLAVVFSSLAAHLHDAWKREKAETEASALSAGGIVEAQRHKGNAAAMREALMVAIETLEEIHNAALTTGYRNKIIKMCGEAREKLKSALSATPRNCDVGTAEEQAKRYHATGEVYHTLTLTNAQLSLRKSRKLPKMTKTKYHRNGRGSDV